MTEATTTPVRRPWWKLVLIVIGAGIAVSLGLLWYINTQSFQALVRRRLVAEIKRITGGRAEIGSFHTTPFRMQMDVRDITVHGLETANDVPLAHADRVVAHLKIISLLGAEVGFHDVVLDHPVIHVAFYPDGSSNLANLSVAKTSPGSAVEQLFSLSIDRLEVRSGQLLWDEQTIPLDFQANDSALEMDYSFLRRRYESRVSLGKVDTKFKDCRPFSWMSNAEFSLGPSSIDVASLKWNSGRSHLEGSGRISDFRHPHIEGSYQGQIDLADAAAIARRRDLRSGILELKGEGSWSLEQFAAKGQLGLKDLAWQNDQIAVAKASVNSDYSVTEHQFKLSRLQGRLLGGGFSGDVEIENWLSPTRHIEPTKNGSKDENIAVITAGRPKAGGEKKGLAVQAGLVRLRLRDISAGEVAAALNTSGHRLGRLKPAGSASGAIETRWKGTPRDAEVEFAVDLMPTARSAPGQFTVAAEAKGKYRGAADALDLSHFRLFTPNTRVQAAGTLSSASAMRLSISTANLEEWQPVIALLGGPEPLPVNLDGNAAFNGVLTGKFSDPMLAGTLTVNDFDVTIPEMAGIAEHEAHWDLFSASVQASGHEIALRGASLRRGNTSADFELTASLRDGHFMEQSPFSLRLNAQNADVGALQALAGYNYPVAGIADLFLQASGTRENPHGDGQIHLTKGSAYGETVQQLDANLHLAQGEARFDNIRLIHEDALIRGSAAYSPSARTYQLDVAGSNLDLSRIRQIQLGRVEMGGRADFTLKGSGTVDAPSVNADIHVHGLTLNHEPTGDLNVQAVSKGGQVHLTGTSEFRHGSLLVDGNIQLRNDFPANFSFQMKDLDLDAILQTYVSQRLTGNSAAEGSILMRGPLRDPSRWIVDGNLTGASVEVESIKLHNQDPIRFSLGDQVLRLEQFHLIGEGTDLTGHGTVQLSGKRELDLEADGQVDLNLLSTLNSDFNGSGLMSVNMTVGGTVADPLPQGRLQVSDGAVTYAGLPSGLSAMKGSVLFSKDRVHIENLTARTGGGTLDLKGDASYFDRQLNFNVTATGKGVRLRYPPGVSSTADAELRWVGTAASSTVSGETVVTKLAVTPGFDFSSYLERGRQLSVTTDANSPLYNVKLDVRVQTAPELQMKTAVARLSGDADLRLRGSVARPAVLGRADILEGQATFHGTRFTLERGDITFVSPISIEPQLNLEASTHVRNYDLSITVTGKPDQPGGLRVSYRSEPPLPQSDIIALLALGRTNQESEQLQEQSGQSAFTDQASSLILNQALNATVSSRLQRLFGASNIKIDPQGLTTETNPTARGPQVTIEQEFANNLSLTYSTNVAQSSQQIIQGEYYFNRNLSAVGTRDQNGVVSFDVRIRRRKK